MPSSTARRRSTIRASRAPAAAARISTSSTGRALVARLDFGKLDKPLELKVATLERRRGQCDRQSRQRARQFRRGPRENPRRMGTGAWRDRNRCARRDEDDGLHRALSRVDGAERLLGCRRPLSRPRRSGPQGRGFHLPLDLLALGYFSRRASFAAARPARTPQCRLRPVAARQPAGEPVRHPARLAIPRPRDVDDDRLSRRPRHRRCVSEGRARLRRERRAGRDGQERQLRPLWRARSLYEARLRAHRQGARSGVEDRRIRL